MANKNLFTKFASLAMAGALAFSGVPVTGLTGAFAATTASTTPITVNAQNNHYWTPGVPVPVKEMVVIKEGNENITTRPGIEYKAKIGSYVTTGTMTDSLVLSTAGDITFTFTTGDNTDTRFEGKSAVKTVKKRSLRNAKVTATQDDLTFNGLTQYATLDTGADVVFEDDSKKVTVTGDDVWDSGKNYYTVRAYSVNATEDSNNGSVVGKDLGNLEKDSKASFGVKINKFEMSDSKKHTAVQKLGNGDVNSGANFGYTILEIDNAAYTGSAVRPNVTVKAGLRNASSNSTIKDDDGLYTLVEGQDYTVDYTNNTGTEDGASEGIVTVKAKGDNFTGAVTGTFKILKKENSLTNAKVTLKDGTKTVENGYHLTYNGTKQELVPVVEIPDKDAANGYKTLVKDSDYTVTYENGIKSEKDNTKSASTVTMTIEGMGSYVDKITRTYVIDPAEISDGLTATVDSSSYTKAFDGKEKEPTLTLTNSKDGTLSGDPKDSTKTLAYEVTYDNNVNAGKGVATVIGTNNYKGTTTVEFDIDKRSINDNKVKIEDIANQIYTGSAVEPALAVTYKNDDNKEFTLVEGEDFTVKYSDNVNTTNNAKAEITGIGNFENSATYNFKIVDASKDIANAEVTLTAPSVQYDGKYHTASVKSVKLVDADGKLVALDRDKDYTVKTVTEKEVGVYNVVVNATGDTYGGSISVPFEITGYDVADAGFSLKKTSVKYNGKNQKPELVVADGTRYDGGNMTEGVDYEVSGIKNIKNVGKLTVKVTGLGAYAGTEKSLTFKVTKADQPMKVSTKTASVKASKVAKKNQTIKASKVFSVSKNQGSVSYKKTSGNSKIKVASNGKITVKKGLKKGTYKIKVKVTAKGNSNYNSGNKTVKATIKVK